MSSTDVAETLTAIQRAAWVVDNAYIIPRAHVDDFGVVTPPENATPRLAIDVIEEKIRPDKRGVTRQGLTVRLFMILLIVAARQGRIWISDLLTLATGGLPLDVQRQLGIVYWATRNRKPRLCTLTAKQLYTMVDNLREHLDVDPDLELPPEEMEARLELLEQIKDAFTYATHVLELHGTSVAIDESGIWSWMRGRRKPDGLPMVDPVDEDANRAAEEQAKLEKTLAQALKTHPDADDLLVRTDVLDMVSPSGEESALIDEDDPSLRDSTPVESLSEASDDITRDTAPSDASAPKKRGKRCWFATWGVKTHKTGKRTSFFGYALHALVRVPDTAGGTQRADAAQRYREPMLIEEFAVTAAATDVVEASLDLIKKRFGRGAPVRDLIGDRHYSYKKYERWASRLWQLQVRPVLDLRENDHGAVDYEGAVVIAGTPHCRPPKHLQHLPRPAKGASAEELQKFNEDITERRKYALKRHKTPWTRNDGRPGGDGKTRWICPAMAGTAGCVRIEGSVDVARENGLPIIDPPASHMPYCKGKPVTIESGAHMKYHQEHYWGSVEWTLSWNRRTYVEGVFGNMKNYATGNIHRGYMQFTGRALVTLGITAAVVAYNLRELQNWHARATKHCPENPLIDTYRSHPLHQSTESVYGFQMLTREERDAWEVEWRRDMETTARKAAGDTNAA